MINLTGKVSRPASVAYRLVPASAWQGGAGDAAYAPVSYDAHRFIHCTHRLAPRRNVGNTFYTDNPCGDLGQRRGRSEGSRQE